MDSSELISAYNSLVDFDIAIGNNSLIRSIIKTYIDACFSKLNDFDGMLNEYFQHRRGEYARFQYNAGYSVQRPEFFDGMPRPRLVDAISLYENHIKHMHFTWCEYEMTNRFKPTFPEYDDILNDIKTQSASVISEMCDANRVMVDAVIMSLNYKNEVLHNAGNL